MENEAAVLLTIQQKFPQVDTAQATTAHHRIFLNVPQAVLLEFLRYAKDELKFDHLCAITGLDTGEGYEFIYHISHDNGILLNVRCCTLGGDGVVIPSVLPIHEGATFFERELEGLLGVKVEGLPEGHQYPLPDNWPAGQYPMRKGWTPESMKEQK